MSTAKSLIRGTPKLVKAKLRLGNGRACQSIASANGRDLYTAQVSIAGEAAGHLLFTRIDMRTWNRTGTLRLRSAGHGVAIGADPAAGWLWSECGPIKRVTGNSARGTRISRFHFSDGRNISHGALVLDPPGTLCTPSVDTAQDQLAIRYQLNGSYEIRVYSLSAAIGGHLTPLSKPLRLPNLGLMQGWCLSNSHIYMTLGSSQVRLVDMSVSTGTHEYVDTTIHGGEPEGIAVIGGKLWFGLSVGKPGLRRLNLYRMET